MDYTPPVPQQSVAPPPTYELKKDVTGKPTPKRGVQIIKDNRGNEFKVPFLPNPKCKRCKGRGYVGHMDINTSMIGLIVCLKCYPLIQHSILPMDKKEEVEK